MAKKFVDSEVIYKESKELEDEEAFSYATQLGFSIVLSMSLQSAIELGVFDILQKAGPNAQLSAKQIASQISCNNPEAASMLDRVLGLFASHDILKCSIIPLDQKLGSFQRLYSMAPVAKFFASDSDGFSLGPLMALIQDNIFLKSWSQLKDAIMEGGVPFDRAHGTQVFEYQSLDSRYNDVFNNAMINQTTIVMKKVLEIYKGFEGIKKLVDVGGGLGISINLITSKYPHIKGINFDLPHVIEHCPSYHGVEHVAGDMFQSVPKGDAIFMKWILQCWSDDECLKLLKKCYEAIPDDGKVIVVEALLGVMPENNAAWKAISQTDILLMAQSPRGKERSDKEYMEIAIGAGFSGIRYECYVRMFCVMEFFK